MRLSMRDRRLKLGLTQQELAKRVGVDHTYISKIENEGLLPGIKVIIAITKELGGRLDEYFEELLAVGGSS
jgi:transcriptional regulator with XRE-family HTH domain